MDPPTPTPARKLNRNIFHKVGRKLEKLEQKLVLPNPYSPRGSEASLTDSTSSYHQQNSEYDDEQSDTLSLQYPPQSSSESPKTALHRKHAHRLDRPHSTSAVDSASYDAQGQSHAEVYPNSSAQYNRETQEICQDILKNNTIRLHDCRDYDKKISLLRTAVSFNTPKITVPVILFLENTLSKPLFYELIRKYPSAVKNYINIAKLRLENDHYIAMLKQFGKNEDVAMIRLRQASQTSDTNSKIALLDQAAVEIASNPWWHLQIAEYQFSIQKQRELQTFLSSAHGNIHLENRTVLDTYKKVFEIDFRRQKNHRNTEKTPLDRSKELETAFHMSPEMIMCGRLSVIMQCGLRMHYDDFVHQAMHQTLFGKKYVIPPENYADMVYNWVRLSGEGEEKASEKAERFLMMIPNPIRRIYFAEKFKNYDVAIDTIANVLRDRAQLEHLRKRIPRDHPSYQQATYLLENTKWRN